MPSNWLHIDGNFPDLDGRGDLRQQVREMGDYLYMLVEQLRCLTQMLGGSVSVSGEYPAWQYRSDSPLRDLVTEVYRRQYGKEPRIEAIHAGLECGLLSDKLPGLDCVSFGPNLKDIHTTKESMSIASVQRTWAFLLEVLKESK